MADIQSTTRAYTIKLSGDGHWRELLWKTHVIVNRGAQVWGDWLLTLRGGLPASLADGHPERRVLLALSWLSVESPASLVPARYLIARGCEPGDDRAQKVMDRFREIVKRNDIQNSDEWIGACEPALTARIRKDAVWVDRSACFVDAIGRLGQSLSLGDIWDVLGRFLGSIDKYFLLPTVDEAEQSGGMETSEKSKELIKEAMGWLCDRFGEEEKGADFDALSVAYSRLSNAGLMRANSAQTLLSAIADAFAVNSDLGSILKCFGASGHKSKTRNRIKVLAEELSISRQQIDDLKRLAAEDSDTCRKKIGKKARHDWTTALLNEVERACQCNYRPRPDAPPIRNEFSVLLDHAARKVRIAHSWIKRAEVERRQFQADAARLDDREAIPQAAKDWLDSFCEERSEDSFAGEQYLIRKRALDGWDKVVAAWAALGEDATREDRVQAARTIQKNLDDNEKFGDIQLFAGFGDDDADEPRACLADDKARIVWQNAAGKPDAQILKDYSAATVAEHNQRRFKVPAYRHPDPLRHPVFVDFGNSRWGIEYSALKAAQDRAGLAKKLEKAKTDKARQKVELKLSASPDLHGVTLDLWNGQVVEGRPLRWSGKRLWKDLDLQHFGEATDGTVTRADRLGRAVEDRSRGGVSIAEVFAQKDWNGRLQIARAELNRLADLIYGKRTEPDYARLDVLLADDCPVKRRKQWERLGWFLTTSAKLKPKGPWLDYTATLPDGIAYKSGRSGPYLDYAVNKDRKGRARLMLARLPGLRVLSLDLGHRYAAACAVWETLSLSAMNAEIQGRRIAAGGTAESALYCHTRHTDERDRERTTIYRRIGPDVLPNGTEHPAPWARLDRQFLIKLQGEDKPARFATSQEFAVLNEMYAFVGCQADPAQPLDKYPGCVNRRIDDLQEDAVRIARRGLQRLGNVARVAYSLTATRKPLAGGKTSELLTPEQRIEYVLDGLALWQELAQSTEYRDEWARHQWDEWIINSLGGPQRIEVSEDEDRSARKQRIQAARDALKPVAERLVDDKGADCQDLKRLWSGQWGARSDEWRRQLRAIRNLILPRIGRRPHGGNAADFARWKENARRIRQTGGLSVKRLRTIRELYQVLKAYRMRPEPDDLRRNVPELGDESLANFGRRILNQLERMREQRIKQLASRIIEGALGVGSENRNHWTGRRRPADRINDARFRPCHAVVVEDLENYRPEETRLRRENRQLMSWAARNVRKYIIEGCQLYGLHFEEVSPNYTSRQDSRTGAPGFCCEEVSRASFAAAIAGGTPQPVTSHHDVRAVKRCVREIARANMVPPRERRPRQAVVSAAMEQIHQLPDNVRLIRLPWKAGEIFVSADRNSPAASGLQRDLNAAANIGLKALYDPDWPGTWWFILVDPTSGLPDPAKVKGCALWPVDRRITLVSDVSGEQDSRRKRGKSGRATVYAWNPLHWIPADVAWNGQWPSTGDYWRRVEETVAGFLILQMASTKTPF